MTITINESTIILTGASPYVNLTGSEASAGNVRIRENAGKLEIYDVGTSVAVVTIEIATGNIVVTSGNVAITTPDALTVGGVIVPQYKDFRVSLDANSVTQIAFITHDAMTLHAVSEAHVVGSTSGTLMLRNCTVGQAASAGLAMLTGTIDLSTAIAANTPHAGVLHATPANILLAAGSMLQIEIAGTMTGLVGSCVTITFKRA